MEFEHTCVNIVHKEYFIWPIFKNLYYAYITFFLIYLLRKYWRAHRLYFTLLLFQNDNFHGRFLLQCCMKSITKINVWKNYRPKEMSGGLPKILLLYYKIAQLTCKCIKCYINYKNINLVGYNITITYQYVNSLNDHFYLYTN